MAPLHSLTGFIGPNIILTRKLTKEIVDINCSQLTTQALGRMPELLLKELAKKIASITAQKSSSQALKSVAKKIPVAGLLIGGYMGGKRLIRGEFGIAVMEIGSGALACVPGEAKFK